MTAKKAAAKRGRTTPKKVAPDPTDEAEVTVELTIDPYSFSPKEMRKVRQALNCEFDRAMSCIDGKETLIDDDGVRRFSDEIKQALIWVQASRDNPDLTYEEAEDIPFGILLQEKA